MLTVKYYELIFQHSMLTRKMFSKHVQFQQRKKVKKFTYKSRADAFLFPHKDSEPTFRKLLDSFCETTKIGGFYYLRQGKSANIIRLFWIFIIFMMLVFGMTLIYLNAGAYHENPAAIVRLNPRFTSHNPFPSITVCPNEPFIYSKIIKLTDNTKIPSYSNPNETALAIYSLAEFVYSAEAINIDITPVLEDYLKLNNFSIIQLTEQIDMDCHDYIEGYSIADIISKCRPNNCPRWNKVLTIFGTCCSFNYFPMNLSNVTAINLSRQVAALNILFSGHNLPGQGLSLIIAYAGEYILPYDSSFKLYSGVDNFYRIDVEQIIASSNFQSLSIQMRRFLLHGDFTEDSDLVPYRTWCSFNCILENIYKICDCHPFNWPTLTKKGASRRDCEAKDVPCFSNKTVIWNVICPECFPFCQRDNYRITSSEASFDQNTSKSVFTTFKNISKLDSPFTTIVYYGQKTVKVSQQMSRYSSIDLLSNLGGILNLTLGISVITIFEILYFFVYKLMMMTTSSTSLS